MRLYNFQNIGDAVKAEIKHIQSIRCFYNQTWKSKTKLNEPYISSILKIKAQSEGEG